jgi:hypothetical protein
MREHQEFTRTISADQCFNQKERPIPARNIKKLPLFYGGGEKKVE